MDSLRIIQQEGYRVEDLSAENRAIVVRLRDMADYVEEMKYDYEDDEETPLHRRVYNSIAREVIEYVASMVDCHVADIQIALAERQED